MKNRGIPVFTTRDADGLIEVFDYEGVRSLYFGTRACQSSMLLSEPAALTLGYTRSMLAALLFQPAPANILLIGLGGGSLARFLLWHLPDTEIVCIEPRASVVELARGYFQLPEHERLRIHITDGASFLGDCPEHSFDLILIDAFDSVGVHPSVCTREFHQSARRALAIDGVVSINLWTTPGSSHETQLRNMALGFGGQVLRLPVEQRANLIALGLDRRHSREELKQLREPALRLADRYGLEFPKQLRSLQHHNGALMRRLLDRHWR
ncbi:MAG TPA: fused MFS/spermidine synthase [Gammaproteobacteria bacterium]